MNQRTMGDYVGRLKGVDMERPAPMLPGQDPPPFGFNIPAAPQFQSEHNLKVLSDYSRAFTDFWFVFNFTGNQIIPAGGQVAITKRIQNDTYFALMNWVIWFDDSDPALNLFTVTLTDASRNLSFFDVPADIRLVHGTPTDPWWLPNMIIFNPNSSMQVSLTDITPAAPADIEVKMLLAGRRYHT